jgi:ferredoxin
MDHKPFYSMESCLVSFPDTPFESITLQPYDSLAEHLTVENSPVLFGCRTGLCGSCLVTVLGDVPPPMPEEQEVLQILAPDNPQARLACQIELIQNIALKV